jgi:uncharacterized protein
VSVTRYDRGTLQAPVRMSNGWLKADGYIARSGLLEYRREDGSTQVEYRPPEEAFSPAALDSFALVPVTVEHPPGLLDASNTKRYAVGTCDAPARDGDRVRARLLLTDAAGVEAAEGGKAQISCGYTCDLDFKVGEFEGKRYDAIQRNVRGNHVALVDVGRAGPEIRLRLDTSDSMVLESESPKKESLGLRGEKMTKLKLDGVEVEVADPIASVVTSEFAKRDAASIEAKKAFEVLQAKADASEVEVKRLTAELADAPKRLAEKAKRLDEIRALAAKASVKVDGLEEVAAQNAIAASVHGVSLEGKSPEYASALWDLAVLKLAKKDTRETAPVEQHTDAVEDVDPLEAAKQKFTRALRGEIKE